VTQLPPDLLKAASEIPADVLAQIDETEVRDRLAEAGRLRDKARATGSSTLRQGYQDTARRVLKAPPRAAVEAQISELMAKADGAATSQWADQCRAQAEQLRYEHSPAPRVYRAPATAPAAVRRPLMLKAAEDDPDGPVTAQWIADLVKTEVARVQRAQKRAAADLTKQATRRRGSDDGRVLYK